MEYPTLLVSNYSSRKITRQEFIKQLTQWQKKHGIDYTCKGRADKNGVYVIYRGEKGTIQNDGLIHWQTKKIGCLMRFRRAVDFFICKNPEVLNG